MAVHKLLEQEISDLKELQILTSQLKNLLGDIHLDELKLETRKKNASEFFNSIQKKENKLVSTLQSKYGEGSINLDKGEINTPSS